MAALMHRQSDEHQNHSGLHTTVLPECYCAPEHSASLAITTRVRTTILALHRERGKLLVSSCSNCLDRSVLTCLRGKTPSFLLSVLFVPIIALYHNNETILKSAFDCNTLPVIVTAVFKVNEHQLLLFRILSAVQQ